MYFFLENLKIFWRNLIIFMLHQNSFFFFATNEILPSTSTQSRGVMNEKFPLLVNITVSLSNGIYEHRYTFRNLCLILLQSCCYCCCCIFWIVNWKVDKTKKKFLNLAKVLRVVTYIVETLMRLICSSLAL